MAWFDIVGGLTRGLGQAAQTGLAEINRRENEQDAQTKEFLARLPVDAPIPTEMLSSVTRLVGKGNIVKDPTTGGFILRPSEAQIAQRRQEGLQLLPFESGPLSEDQFKHYTSYYKLPTELFAKDKSGQYIPRRTPEQQLAFDDIQAKLRLPALRTALLADINKPTWAGVPAGEKVRRAIEANVDLMQIPNGISATEMMQIPQYIFDIQKAQAAKSATPLSAAQIDLMLPPLGPLITRLDKTQDTFSKAKQMFGDTNVIAYKQAKSDFEQAQRAYDEAVSTRRRLAAMLSGLSGNVGNWTMVENK